MGVYCRILFRKNYEAAAFAEITNWNDIVTCLTTILVSFALLMLDFLLLYLHASNTAVGLLHFLVEDKLEIDLIGSA